MDMLRRCADMANEWGCGMVRGFAFWNRGEAEKPWEAMLAAYAPVPAILEEKGVVLGLENEHACYVGTAGHARRFLDSLGCPRVKAVWDPANHVHDPDAPGTPAYPEGYELLRGDICHVHMKDAGPGEDGQVRCRYMGTGAVDWRGQFQALKDDDYSGYVSLETHVRAEDFPEVLRAEFGEHLTGGSREGASRVCLAWVREALGGLA
jgi:sugar phosphate isomerase/epimerase